MKIFLICFHSILGFLYIASLFFLPFRYNFNGGYDSVFQYLLRFDLFTWIFLCFVLAYHIIKFSALLTNKTTPLTSFLFVVICFFTFHYTKFFVLIACIDLLSHLLVSYIKIKRKEENHTW